PFERFPEVLASADVLTGVLEEEAGIFSVPSKVLSYLCAGRPILLAVPGVNLAARIVEGEEAGLTVPPADESAFLDAAESFFGDAERARQMAENARAYAERTFEVKAITAKFNAIFSSLSGE
ncbi:MAG: glycosyltransferase family 4 protein, partial [bacterium]|nr:glycosyltransferase family 4 protein [bacterium]